MKFGSEINNITLQVFKPDDEALPPNNNSTDLAISFVDWFIIKKKFIFHTIINYILFNFILFYYFKGTHLQLITGYF